MTITSIDPTYPYTMEEAAKILKVHRDTVKRYYERKGLVVSRLGEKTIRILGEDLINFVKNQRS